MVVEIINGMSMPKMKRRGAPPKYPWLQLKPGQAFKFAADVSFAGARSMASQMVSAHKIKFAVRQCDDGVYCWRIDGTEHELQNGNYRQAVDAIENYADVAKPATLTSVMGYEKTVPRPGYKPENSSPGATWKPGDTDRTVKPEYHTPDEDVM